MTPVSLQESSALRLEAVGQFVANSIAFTGSKPKLGATASQSIPPKGDARIPQSVGCLVFVPSSSSLTLTCFLLACLTGMESPINAERLMTPTANDRGGRLSRTRREAGFLLPISKDEAHFEKRFSGFAFGR
jgi:hypothetical protein